MEAIYIPQLLQAPEKSAVLPIQDFLPNLDSLTPVQGQLKVIHQGNYLQVSAEVATIVTLSCDRCLQHYNHRLEATASELLWLEEQVETTEMASADVLDLPLEGPVETLSPTGEFDPADWLYQQLCLQLPQRQLCDRNCPGLESQATPPAPILDQRWAALAALQTPVTND